MRTWSRVQLALSGPDLQIRLPRVYQNDRAVAGRAVRRGNRITFELAAYDRSRPLVIDPVLSYAAIFGGGGSDEGRAIAVDFTGSAYVIGNAFDGNFPVVNWKLVPGLLTPIVNAIVIDPSDPCRIYTGTQLNSQDVFVMKIAQ